MRSVFVFVILCSALILFSLNKRWSRILAFVLFSCFLWSRYIPGLWPDPVGFYAPDNLNNRSMANFFSMMHGQHSATFWNPFIFGGMPSITQYDWSNVVYVENYFYKYFAGFVYFWFGYLSFRKRPIGNNSKAIKFLSDQDNLLFTISMAVGLMLLINYIRIFIWMGRT